jgi:hypothetical protein
LLILAGLELLALLRSYCSHASTLVPVFSALTEKGKADCQTPSADVTRCQDGNVILVIDDISKEVKKYLVDMKVQTIRKEDVLKMAAGFDDPEDGIGGAKLLVVTGNYPIDYSIKSERNFKSEDAACEAAEESETS